MGLEPTTLGTTIRCSNQLSYTHHIFCLASGKMARQEGFAFLRKSHGGSNNPLDCLQEPPFESLACASSYSGTPGGIRTPGLLLRRQLLYPAELKAHREHEPPAPRQCGKQECLERVMGIEPTRPAWKAGILPLNYTRMGTDLNDVSQDIIAYCGWNVNAFFHQREKFCARQ